MVESLKLKRTVSKFYTVRVPKQKNKKTTKIDDCVILSFAIPHLWVVLHLLIPWENLGLECWCLREEEFRVHAEKYLGRGNKLTKNSTKMWH